MTNYLEGRVSANRFAAKLTFAFRVAIYADHIHRGTTYPVLAQAFGVNEQTVSKICRSQRSRLYHSVFAEVDRLGVERAWKEYVQDSGLMQRIDDATWKRKMGTDAPQPHYVASGPGRYWLKNWYDNKVEVELQPYEDIKQHVTFDPLNEFKKGIWFKHPEAGWSFDERPFQTYEEALRFFAEFPPTWGK